MRSRGWRRPSAIVQADVGMEAVAAALAAVTRFLVAAERRGRVEPVERVGPDHARLHPPDHRQAPAALLRPDAGRQAVRRVVGLLHGLLRRPEEAVEKANNTDRKSTRLNSSHGSIS